jgi:hypothetical protein
MSSVRERVRAHGPVLVSVTFSVLWLGLALRAPTTTYHLVPAVVAASWPLTARRLRGQLSLPAAIRAGFGGLVVAAATTIELAGLDALRGPALVGGSATAESALVAVAGAGWAVRATVGSRPGLVLGMLGATETERPAAST